jgi:urocanate hydratase
MTESIASARPVRAPRGTELTCANWQIEAAYRMLQNNLDPEVAEDPDEARRLRRPRQGRAQLGGASTRSARDAQAAEADETCSCSRASPVGVVRTHEDAPRVLIANSQPRPPLGELGHFDELAAKGLMMYGQMTAGSWIYIGTQGILQGTYETFAECANRHFGGSLAGKLVVTAGLRRHGRRPAARRHPQRRDLPDRGRRPHAPREAPARPLPRHVVFDLDAAIDRARERRRRAEGSIGVHCNASSCSSGCSTAASSRMC